MAEVEVVPVLALHHLCLGVGLRKRCWHTSSEESSVPNQYSPIGSLNEVRLCFLTSTTMPYRFHSLVSWWWIATWLLIMISGRESAC